MLCVDRHCQAAQAKAGPRCGRRALLCCAALVLNLAPAGYRAAAAPADIPSTKGIRTNADRVAYLNGCGWQVTEEPLAVEEIRIPEEMDESYRHYLELQSVPGLLTWSGMQAGGSGAIPMRSPTTPPGSPVYRPISCSTVPPW